MAAFLTIDQLRALAVPILPEGGEPPMRRRPILARWMIGPDGGLTCRWETGAADPPLPPTG